MLSHITHDDKTFTIANIHNFGLTSDVPREVLRRLRPLLDKALRDPTKHGLVLAGDWSFLAPGDLPREARTGLCCYRRGPGSQLQASWEALLARNANY